VTTVATRFEQSGHASHITLRVQLKLLESMRFSVLIPTFNRATFLRQAIDSALSQTYSDREIIVIDDGSTDATRNTVSSYGTQIHYVRKENAGKAAALNTGIRLSRGDVLIVLDDDDFFPPGALASHADALKRDLSADFSYGKFVRFRGDAPPLLSNLQDMEFVPRRDPRRLAVKLMENCFLPNPSWAVRRAAQLAAGSYDEELRYSEDYDMILRLAKRSEGIFCDGVVLFQRKHLAHRGPLSEQTIALDVVDKWLKYDARIFEKIDHTWPLDDFRPFAGPSHSCAEAALLLQKGIILFQRKVYEGSLHALLRYRRSLEFRAPTSEELAIAAGLLGCRHGLADVVLGGPTREQVINAFRAADWPLWTRLAFASQLRWRVRAAAAAADADYARKLIHFSAKAFGLVPTIAVLGSRYSAGRRMWMQNYRCDAK
jgi:glycosyltransferase involved in cell wall biosynthesis